MITQVCIKDSKICFAHGRVLIFVLRHYVNNLYIKYVNIIEVGTARDFSPICMAKALQEDKVKGKIITIDFLPIKKKMYWNCN
ncbi:MAG: hypothetical protein CMG05_04115 [Candidatus Marinimicrobia bacterium]|nr:hypothetical protein [Candidatus Neomarinimicrobiota bacterium]